MTIKREFAPLRGVGLGGREENRPKTLFSFVGNATTVNFLKSQKVEISGWPRFGSVRLRFGDGTVRAVPVFGSGGSSILCVSVQFNREDGSGSGFGSWKMVPAVPVPRSVPGKTVPTVPVSGSGSVPGPP